MTEPRPTPIVERLLNLTAVSQWSSGVVQLSPLDDDPYPDLVWTSLLDWFTGGHLPGAAAAKRGTRVPAPTPLHWKDES